MERKSNIMKSLIATMIFLAVALVMFLVYKNSTAVDPNTKGDKDITIQVIVPEDETKTYAFSTDADNLRQVLEDENLIEGEEGAYGFFITSVNKRAADSSKQEWWCITKSGEDVYTGVDQTMIQDGDEYELTLMIGY